MPVGRSRNRAADTDLAAYIRSHLPPGTSYETMVQLANVLAYILKVEPNKSVEFSRNEVLTDMAAAATLLRASPASAKKVDLSNYTEARIVAVTGGVAGPAGAKVIAKYKTTLGANDAAYAALGTSAIEAAIDTINTAVASAWVPLAALARADVFVAVSTSGGDADVDPAIGTLEVQFR